MKATRDSYGEALVELGKKNEKIVVLDADLATATKTIEFKKEFPNRFFDIGIAEQDMMGTAAGLALGVKFHLLAHLLYLHQAERMIKLEIKYVIQI